MATLSAADYVVIAVYLSVIVGIGLLAGRGSGSLREYFVTSGNIPWWAAGITVFASLLSANSYLGGPGWIFARDSSYVLTGSIIGVGTTVLAGLMWLPFWSRFRPISIFEYLAERYNPAVRGLAAFVSLAQISFWICTALVTAARAFQATTGIGVVPCLAFAVLLTLIYTVLGGARSVVWTDVAQFAVLMGAYVVVAVVAMGDFDWDPRLVYRLASSVQSADTGHPHTRMLSFELSLAAEATFWSLLFLRLIEAIRYGSQQIAVQRLMSAGTRKAMFRAMLGFAGCALAYAILCTIIGWTLVAFYARHPERARGLLHPDQVLPYFVVNEAPPVIPGLLIAGVLSAMMATLSSALNSMSTIVTIDFYRPYLGRGRSEEEQMRASRWFTLVLGMLLLALAIWLSLHADKPAFEREQRLFSLTAAPVATFFILGAFNRRANTPGALIGGCAGVLFSLACNGFPGLIEPRFYGINWIWVSGLSLLVSLAVGLAASYLFAPPSARAAKAHLGGARSAP